MIPDTILGTVGNTPIIRINQLAPDHVTMYVKREAFNPMSSVKDRLAFAIINDAEQRGEAARRVAEQSPNGTVLLAMLPDTGERHLSAFLFEGINDEVDGTA